ncbi:unnamed protein product [Polarella glacialis]|uniref:Uncharacterized protein n=1 Tax=Polarella glacialis TaxID=89957 RepID=A0A813DZY1_POLGL|nr:unnamed protein product [Polarella glacialis]
MAIGGVEVPGPRGPDQFSNKQLQLQETLSRCPACGWIRQQQSMLGVPQSDSTAHESVWLPAFFVLLRLLALLCLLARPLSFAGVFVAFVRVDSTTDGQRPGPRFLVFSILSLQFVFPYQCADGCTVPTYLLPSSVKLLRLFVDRSQASLFV